MIEHFQGTGYINGKVDPEYMKIGLDREEYWIKKLWTIYPYGLNKRARDIHTKAYWSSISIYS